MIRLRLFMVPLAASVLIACGGASEDADVTTPNTANSGANSKRADNQQAFTRQDTTPLNAASVPVTGNITGLVGETTLRLYTVGYQEEITTETNSFAFSQALADGEAYAVTIVTQPPEQTCVVANGIGVTDADTSPSLDISITCASRLTTLSGVTTGLQNAVELSLQAGPAPLPPVDSVAPNFDEVLNVTDENFVFNTQLDIGEAYAVTITQQPTDQFCTLANATGTVLDAAPLAVTVNCEDLSAVLSSVSGTLTLNDNVISDSDLNDPSTTLVDNSSFATAQNIPNNVTVHGFVTLNPTGNRNDQFGGTTDTHDYYSVTLEQGQSIQLQVVDAVSNDNPNETPNNNQSTYQGDLDLYLFDTAFNLIAFSNSTTDSEMVSIPDDGQYYVDVVANAGASKYILNILPVSATSTINQSVDFLPNEAIIRINDQMTSFASAQAMSSMQLRHQQDDRATLADFSNMTSFATAQNTSNQNATAMNELADLNAESYEKIATLNQIKALRGDPSIAYVEPNFVRHPKLTPNDEFYDLQWHYPAMNLPLAWDISTGTPNVGEDDIIVAVVDTGVVLNHPEFVGQLVPGYDFIASPFNARDGNGIDPNPDDPGDSPALGQSSWHGTHVAGTIAARSDNNIGVAGVSWGAKIMPLRVLGAFGGTSYDIMQALRFAAGLNNDSGTVPDQPADIINLSLGGLGFSAAEAALYELLAESGIIVVAAAGNENTAAPSYPAAYTGVISVAALDVDDERAPYSNFGDTVDLAAPGGDIFADRNNDGFPDGVLSAVADDSNGNRVPSLNFYNGTSMAAPHVAGMAALMKAVYPDLNATSFDALLQNGLLTNEAGEPGRDDIFGFGIADAHKAVLLAQSLANGDVVVPPLPSTLIAQPTTLNAGTLDLAQFTLANSGDETSTIDSITPSDDWIEVEANTIDDDGFGLYDVRINREGLNDGNYTGTITVSAIGTNPIVISVSMTAGDLALPGKFSEIYTVIVDANNQDVIAEVLATDNGDGTASFTIPDVPAGYYHIFASTDIDNDLTMCQMGEGCGAYPSLAEPQVLLINGEDLLDINFAADILSETITFGPEAKPIQRPALAPNDNDDSTETLLIRPLF